MEKRVVATNVLLIMRKNPSFHIITKGELTHKGDFMGYDTYNNSVFISQKTKLIHNIKDISDDSPLFCLANTAEVFNKNIDGRKLHFLKCYYAEFDLIKILSAFTDDIIIELSSSEKVVENFMFIKLIINEYNLHKNKKQLLASNNIGFNRNKDEDNYELPFLLLSSRCFELKHKLDRYIYLFDYEKEIDFKNGDECLDFFSCDKLFGLENKKNYVFKIDLIPLYPSIKKILDGIDKPPCRPFQKIITRENLISFDFNKKRYFDQFFKLINNEYNPETNMLQYHLEHFLVYLERIKSKFGTMYTFSITPMIPKNHYYKNTTFKDLNKNLIDLTTYLEKINILNVIVLPPEYIYWPIEEEIEYYLDGQNEDLYNSFDGWAELGDQEMNRWDDETGGDWRIENDFG